MKKPNVKLELVRVTPDIARQYLEMNQNNRPVSSERVEQYAKVMKDGNWTENGCIEFGQDGTLYDGQTRLHAVIKSGRAAWFTVKHGVSALARPNIDLGRARTAGNWLSMVGIPHGNRVAAALRLIYRIEAGVSIWRGSALPRGGTFTPMDAERMLKKYPDLVEWAKIDHIGKCPRGIAPSTLVAFSYVFSRRDHELAKVLVEGMIDGYDKASHPAFHRLREIIIRQPTNPTPYPKGHIHMFLVKAWNAERSGKAITVFRWNPDEEGAIEIK